VQELSDIKVIPLSSVLESIDWDRFEYIDYIKIDAQGADFDIIQSAGNYLSERVVFITAEPESNDYANCNHNTMENMETYLKIQNFIKRKRYGVIHIDNLSRVSFYAAN
jgi:hypothetical protein